MRIVSRKEWGARAAPSHRMKLPATSVVLHHTVTKVTSDPLADIRLVESIGIKRFGHISYSYCIHPEGHIFEGCGDLVGAHTANRNSTTFGIALIGNYDSRAVKMQQVDAVRWLVADLAARDWLKAGVYPTGGHRDLAATACPGEKAYRVLDQFRLPWCEPEPLPVKELSPMYDPPLGPIAAVWQDEDGKVIAAVSPDGDVYAWAVAHAGNVRGKPYWGDRKAALIGPPQHGGAYQITATSGEAYELPDGLD